MELQGFDQLLKRIDELGRKGSRIENKALRAGAEVVQKESSKLAPRRKIAKKHLADNIQISKVKKRDGTKFIEVGPQKGDNSEFFYGKFLEWGTSKMSPRPFLGPALASKKDEAMEVMRKSLKDDLGL